MRLTCPNCGAQYEVPDEVIPETGRDVQCSNCGDTWFQHHPDHPPTEENADDAPASSPDWEVPETEAPADKSRQDNGTADTPTQAEETRHRRELDPAIADVLREEAEHERQARDAERRGGVETQPDLGLGSGAASEEEDRAQQARRRVSRLRGDENDMPPTESADTAQSAAPEARDDDIDPTSRSNLLPNIDEINSSLNAGDGRIETPQAAAEADRFDIEEDRSSGFRGGFILAVVVVLVAAVAYLFAPLIAEAVPALAGPLSDYVDAVNAGRIWLDDRAAEAVAWLMDQTSGG